MNNPWNSHGLGNFEVALEESVSQSIKLDIPLSVVHASRSHPLLLPRIQLEASNIPGGRFGYSCCLL